MPIELEKELKQATNDLVDAAKLATRDTAKEIGYIAQTIGKQMNQWWFTGSQDCKENKGCKRVKVGN